jgi:hypothetical protein
VATLGTTPPCGVHVQLRQHQNLLVHRLLDASATIPHRQLFVAPTGSGKTIAGIVSGVCMLERGIVDGVHVAVPKSIVRQFQYEIERLVPLHLASKFEVFTHAKYFQKEHIPATENKLLIVDEAHAFSTDIAHSVASESSSRRSKPPSPAALVVAGTRKRKAAPSPRETSPLKRGARAFHAIRAASHAKGVLLMTATPLLNGPLDLMNLLCMVCGFTYSAFTTHTLITPVQKLLNKAQKQFLVSGNRAALRRELQSPMMYMFVKWMARKIVFAGRSTEGLPRVTDLTVKLPMSPDYLKLYNAVECNQLMEFHKQLQKRNASQLQRRPAAAAAQSPGNPVKTCDTQNPCLVSPLRCVFQPEGVDAFYMKLRQLVNGVTRRIVSSKVAYAVRIAREGHLKQRRVVVYSNFLEGGMSLVAHQLKTPPSAAVATQQPHPRVPFVQIMGKCTQHQRHAAVQALNSGEVYIMLLSRAGCEGLDLKGVRDVVLLEPHFHNERPRQVIGRAIRFRSHEALPLPERNVTVHRLLLQKPVDNHATWAEAERHNATQIRKLLDTYRVRAYQQTIVLSMNVPNKLLFDNVRQLVWQEKLMNAQTAAVKPASSRSHMSTRAMADPFDRVKTDTSSVDPTDFTIYIHFTDRIDPHDWESDGMNIHDMFTDQPPQLQDTAASSHNTPQVPFTFEDSFTLRNVHRDLSVDDVVQELAERKETLNQQFLQLFKRFDVGE